MRTGNLPVNMKKNRVLQIIPCESSYFSCAVWVFIWRLYELVMHKNSVFINAYAPVQTLKAFSINQEKCFSFILTDEFNRVIIPVKRGEENTDYVNASFIDVSVTVSGLEWSISLMRAIDRVFLHLPFSLRSRSLSFFASLNFFSVDITPVSFLLVVTGLSSEGCLYGEPGAPATHYRGLLEDDLGVEKLLHSHAH